MHFVLSLLLIVISSCAVTEADAGTVTISAQEAEYLLDQPITIEVKNESTKRLFYWIEIDRLGSDGEWYLTYSSLLGLRQDSEPAMAVLKVQENHALFWLPTVDPEFQDMFSRTESRTFRFSLKYVESEKELARSVEGKPFKIRKRG
jgi:hypothetical protein